MRTRLTDTIFKFQVLAKLPGPCRFYDQGCEVEMMKAPLDVHERVCPFRLVPCVDLACQQKISLSKVFYQEYTIRNMFVRFISNLKIQYFC